MVNELDIPKIKVVSLPSNTQRRESISRQFSELKIDYEFHDAVNGRALPPSMKKKYSSYYAFTKGRRTLNAGEIGCFASHYQIWEYMILNQVEELLIFEDDILINKEFFEMLKSRHSCEGGYSLLNFTNSIAKPVDLYAIPKHEKYSWCRFEGKVNTTSAYLVKLEGAKILHKAAEYFWCPVDDFISYTQKENLNVKGVTPIPLAHGKFKSNIWENPAEYEKHKKSQLKYHHYLSRLQSIGGRISRIFFK